MDSKKIDKKLEPFLKKLEKKFQPDTVILFGSRAQGTAWKQSDYDFIVISTLFKEMHWLDRISQIVQLWDLPYDIDVLPYTPQEFSKKKKESSVVRTALKQGICIAK